MPKLIGELNDASFSTEITEEKRRALCMALAQNLKGKYVYSESRNHYTIDCVLQNKDDQTKFVIALQQLNKNDNKAYPAKQLNRLHRIMSKDADICFSILYRLNYKELFIESAYSLFAENLTAKKNWAQHAEINPLEYITLTDGNELFVKNITIENYKAISASKPFKFKGRFTVLIGDNAQGKTTILNAIRASLLGIMPVYEPGNKDSRKADIGRNAQQIKKQKFYGITEGILRWSDIHSNISPAGELITNGTCSIKASNKYFSWGAYRLNRKGSVRYSDTGLSEFYMQELYRQQNDNTIKLPLIVYYGTDRTEQSNEILANARNGRWKGYQNCLGHHISYNQFKQWYRGLQLLAEKSDEYSLLRQTFIDILKDCFKDDREIVDLIYYEKLINDNGVNEKVDDIAVRRRSENGNDCTQILLRNLSSGYRVMLTLVADMAMRCLLLNEHLGKAAARETSGVVLIDEIDMHLHPLWQRHIVTDLMHAFPKIQFITTTHSPFIVQSLLPNQIINLNETPLMHNPLDSNLATNAYYMGVESDRSVRFEEEMEDAYDFLKYIDKEGITIEEIDKLLSAYALRHSDNPVYVAKLRIESNLAKNEFLYNEFLKDNNEADQ